MKFPKGHDFDLIGGLVITVFLEDNLSLTGTFLAEIEDRHHDDPTPIHVNVEEEAEFILLQLTCPFCAPGLPFLPVNTIVAVNVEQILFISPGQECVKDAG